MEDTAIRLPPGVIHGDYATQRRTVEDSGYLLRELARGGER